MERASAHQTCQMRLVDDPLPAPVAHGMIGHDLAGVAHDDAASEDHDLNGLADLQAAMGQGAEMNVQVAGLFDRVAHRQLGPGR